VSHRFVEIADTFSVEQRLPELLAAAGLRLLSSEQLSRFSSYFELLMRWNAKMNLTAVRDPEQILSRHFLESIACAQALPMGIATLLDFGSGAGFPGIPVAILKSEIAVTLAESKIKKATFLREVLRTLGVSGSVHHGRAEMLNVLFDCVTLRAVDRMEQAVAAASQLVRPGGWLAAMTTELDLEKIQSAADSSFVWETPIPLPGGEQRVFFLGRLAL
jgi:16S rRNA (guanine527-N7)-methyltransferase